MRRRRALVVVVVVAVVAVVGVGVAARLRRSPTFGSFRLVRTQEVPGTFGLVVRPPSARFDPSISPAQAERIASQGQAAPGPVYLVLADVPAAYIGSAEAPAWLVIVRNLCFASEKGDLVSQTRRPPGKVTRCTLNNLWVQVIDAATGKRVSVVRGYDISGTWRPATAPAAT